MADDYTTVTGKYTMTTLEGSGFDRVDAEGQLTKYAEKDAWSDTTLGKVGRFIGDDRVPAAVAITDKEGRTSYLVGMKLNGDQEDLSAAYFILDTGKRNELGKEIYTPYKIDPAGTITFNKENDPAHHLQKGAVTPESADGIEGLADAIRKVNEQEVAPQQQPPTKVQPSPVPPASDSAPPTPQQPPKEAPAPRALGPHPLSSGDSFTKALEQYRNSDSLSFSSGSEDTVPLSTPNAVVASKRTLS